MILGPVDPPVLVLAGIAVGLLHRFRLSKGNADRYVVLSAVVVGAFWLHLLAGELVDLSVLPVRAGVGVLVGTCYALSYPFWYWLGTRIVFVLIGRRPEQGGLLWIYVIDDYTDDFEEQWE